MMHTNEIKNNERKGQSWQNDNKTKRSHFTHTTANNWFRTILSTEAENTEASHNLKGSIPLVIASPDIY